MKTFEELYDLTVKMAKASYSKLGWDNEQAPMIFLHKEDGTMKAFLVPSLSDKRNEAMNMLSALHRAIARYGAAVLMIESWVRTDMSDEDLELHKQGLSMESDPRREEAIMINIRYRDQQRIGMIKLDRDHKRMTAMDLNDPKEPGVKASGRFVG